MKPAFLALNLHRPVDDGMPTVALIDESLLEAAREFRWLTTCESDKPQRSIYDPSVKRARLESLARWVWAQKYPAGAQKPDFLGHANHDLLDCRSENVVPLRRANAGRSDKTGVFVQQALDEARETAASVRDIAGVPFGGEAARRGCASPFTPDQGDEIVRLRAENAAMPLCRFNAEIVRGVVGKRLGHRVLTKLLASPRE